MPIHAAQLQDSVRRDDLVIYLCIKDVYVN